MVQLLVISGTPADPGAFDRHYRDTHIPIAKTIPGVRSYTISKGPVTALAGTAPYVVATLEFNSMADFQAALASPQGQAAAADLPNFASGGATLLVYEPAAV
ncbi:MAG: EthD family reductase [Bryobacteraceae bacterium]